jgi:hypothetical protein
MKAVEIFESEEIDEETRSKSIRVFNSIQQFLDNHEGFLKLRQSEQFGGSLYEQATKLGLPNEYQDLIIIFAPKTTNVLGGFGHTSSKKIIIIHCLIEPYSTKFLATRFGNCKYSFIHELSHYFLEKISKDKSKSSSKYNSGDIQGYFNTPQELQAHYMEMTSNALSLAKALPVDHEMVKNLANETTSSLIDWIKKYGQVDDFINNLTQINKRKIDKRLARFIETTLRPIFQH